MIFENNNFSNENEKESNELKMDTIFSLPTPSFISSWINLSKNMLCFTDKSNDVCRFKICIACNVADSGDTEVG